MMKGSFDPSVIENASLEIDPRMVRGEAIRAIRGFTIRSDQPRDRLISRPRPVSFYAIVRIMRDLELTLMAISGSLAEGIEHATGSSSASRLDLDKSAPQLHQHVDHG